MKTSQVWGWIRKDIPKRRIFPTIFLSFITLKSYNISFIVAEALDHSWMFHLLELSVVRFVRRGQLMQQLSFIRSVVCPATGPWTLPKTVLHRLRAGASSFNFRYPLVFISSSSGCLCLPSRLLVTSNFPPLSHSLTCFRRQFLRKMWPLLLDFLLFIIYLIYLSTDPLAVAHLHINNT
jgi:hypothetical protein